jgi:hypothetical protein
MMKRWEKDTRARLQQDERLRRLAAKYPLALLHSRHLYAGGDYKRSAYSFIYGTGDDKQHSGNAQLLFHNGAHPNTLWFNLHVGDQHLVVDLGAVDFEKDPKPAAISIDAPGVCTGHVKVFLGHVYLERVRDDRGNNFYVVFQVVAVDPRSRYVAFLWRRLPGGTLVRPKRPGVTS